MSVLYRVYEKAIGKQNMEILSSFKDLPMYNFGVRVSKTMSDEDRVFLEQNIQASLAQREIDLEDAISIRQLNDIDQAQRLLVVRRKRRAKDAQRIAQQNMQMQAQANAQASQAASQARIQELQAEAQLDLQKMQAKGQIDVQVAAAMHQMRKEIETIKAQATLGFKTDDQEFKEKIEVLKEDRKDDRVQKQAVEQSKLISQRQGGRGELEEVPDNREDIDSILEGLS
tara:strand:- start:539 stop:1222 length:684 start_codon:yes stop_codon:yes gene_type:complete